MTLCFLCISLWYPSISHWCLFSHSCGFSHHQTVNLAAHLAPVLVDFLLIHLLDNPKITMQSTTDTFALEIKLSSHFWFCRTPNKHPKNMTPSPGTSTEFLKKIVNWKIPINTRYYLHRFLKILLSFSSKSSSRVSAPMCWECLAHTVKTQTEWENKKKKNRLPRNRPVSAKLKTTIIYLFSGELFLTPSFFSIGEFNWTLLRQLTIALICFLFVQCELKKQSKVT